MNITEIIAKELNIKQTQVQSAVELIDEGNTIPFIARYRKERTGALDDQILRELNERLEALRALEERQNDVIRLIDEQGKLTEDIRTSVLNCTTVTEVDDIYRPFRPKRRTRASIATEKGLLPLAEFLLAQEPGADVNAYAEQFINEEKGVNSTEEALKGAMDIIAEQVSDNADYRKTIREFTFARGLLVTKAKKEEDSVYRLYYDYSEPVKRIPSHRVLAINRGEREDFLSVKIQVDTNWIITNITFKMCKKIPAPSTKYVADAICDAYERLIAPSVENEIRNQLTEMAEKQAIHVFGENLKSLLLTPPIKNCVVMGFDPAYRTGCKIAVVNDLGDVLDTTVVYPTPPQNKKAEAEKILLELIDKHHVNIISIGNGTASKESELFVAELIKKSGRDVKYIMTNEAGASVYSASKLGAEEFPQFDVSLRSAVSIARRIEDPLAELVKIDPKSIGVGQYQHDITQKQLSESLDGVVESCVSNVGADLNTASVSLLSHIAGITSKTAQNIYDYRIQNKRFEKRSELKKVKGIGEKAFVQCAGFLRVPESNEILDNTAVHPESYPAAKKLLEITGYTDNDVRKHNLSELPSKLDGIGWDKAALESGVGVPTLRDIVNEIMKPGRDPRDGLPLPILRSDVMDINDLKVGMKFVGTVRNVADFGAFVDIGVHQDGLIHRSKLCKTINQRPLDVVSIGDIINVTIADVDVPKKRIALEPAEN